MCAETPRGPVKVWGPKAGRIGVTQLPATSCGDTHLRQRIPTGATRRARTKLMHRIRIGVRIRPIVRVVVRIGIVRGYHHRPYRKSSAKEEATTSKASARKKGAMGEEAGPREEAWMPKEMALPSESRMPRKRTVPAKSLPCRRGHER